MTKSEWSIWNKAVIGVLPEIDGSMFGSSSEHDEGADLYKLSLGACGRWEVVTIKIAPICRKPIGVDIMSKAL